MQGTVTDICPLKRKKFIQELMLGDVDDLAEKGVYKLLTGDAGNLKNLESGSLAISKMLNPSLKKKKKKKTKPSMGKLNPLFFFPLEQKVLGPLKQSHTENKVQTLRDAVFPELNLRSYQACKSDLAVATISHILRGRPDDDVPMVPNTMSDPLPWLVPMEWED